MGERARQPRRAERAGFTAVELLLAMGLAVVVCLGAFGLLMTVYRSDNAGQNRFADEAELQNLQRAVRALSRSVTCKAPPPTSAIDAPVSEEAVQEAEAELRAKMDRAGQPYTPESLRAEAMEKARRDARENFDSRPDERERIPPRFELRLQATGSGGALPVLEALLTDAPVAPRWTSDPEERMLANAGNLVRGVIEGVRSAEFEKNGWTIQWRPIEPPGNPVPLARRVAGWEWSALPRKTHQNESTPYVETAAAWYSEDFPRAIRLVVATMGGSTADWLFDLPRPITEVVDVDDTPSDEPRDDEDQPGADPEGAP